MAQPVKIWYDAQGDFLEVLFSDEAGYMRQTQHDAVMERVSDSGKLLGFSIMNVSRISPHEPLVAQLAARISDAA